MSEREETAAGGVTTRWMELIVALALVAIGALVIYDSHRVGIEWADDGPRAGYFPNIIGWILTMAGGWIVVTTIAKWKALAGSMFVSRAELKPVLQMLVPTAIYIAVIAVAGIYVASAVFIAVFMRWQGHYRWPITLGVSISVPLVIFGLFEIWFLVPLPKGPLERLLGF